MESKTVKVAALMTAARYENTWCRNQIEFSLRALGIPFSVSGGVYYGQCMQIMMDEVVNKGIDYIVTIDGDTVFYPHQLQRLISIAVQEQLDAICAMQVRRGAKHMLGTIEGKRSTGWDGYPVKVDTAHFGLTVISCEKLKTTAKPWFFCQPDKNGNWSEDKIDSDVWFWKQWKEAGNSIYLDPGTRIGHVEEMVVLYEDDMTIQHIYPKEWVERHASETNKAMEEQLSAEAV